MRIFFVGIGAEHGGRRGLRVEQCQRADAICLNGSDKFELQYNCKFAGARAIFVIPMEDRVAALEAQVKALSAALLAKEEQVTHVTAALSGLTRKFNEVAPTPPAGSHTALHSSADPCDLPPPPA